MPKKVDHLHRYKKINLGRDGKEYYVYRCMVAGCPHYVPVHLSEGKVCECSRCKEPMIITKSTLQGSTGRAMARPHCIDCTKRKGGIKNEDVAAIAAFLEGSKTETN